MIKKLKYFTQSLIIKFFLLIFWLLPAKVASGLGGAIAQILGPLIRGNKTAKKNVNKAFSQFKSHEVNQTVSKMWNNLGRVVAEFSHLNGYIEKNFDEIVEVEGLEHLKKAQESGKPIIFFGAHVANWEILPKVLIKHFDKIAVVYRKANNPHADKIIQSVRDKNVITVAKGSKGARKLVKMINQNIPIAMLVDQKQNDGIAVPFFGRDAMTAPAVARLGIKYDCAMIPIFITRLDMKMKFKCEVLPELPINSTSDPKQVMTNVNKHIEEHVKKQPYEWFWVHNRWPK